MTGTTFTAGWIAAQRWFRSKGRAVDAVTEVDRAPLPGSAAALLTLAVSFADGGKERYVVAEVDGREARDGEGAWTALASAIAAETDLPGTEGWFRCRRTDALATLTEGTTVAALPERGLGVEQSNTSVALGERLMLKLYRLLEPGTNPELEVCAFLGQVGFAGAPRLAGSATYEGADGGQAAAAIVQELIPAAGDAWAAMLEALADEPEAGAAHAAAIGRVTADLHAALQARPEDPDFPARPATTAETAEWRASAERQLAQAVGALDGEAHDRLVSLAPAITARFADTFGSASGRSAVSRIHGDYHLGQLLRRIDGGFSVIDFEGEPARPLAERRAPSSPLRDVAGMLRSLDYAARTAEAGAHATAFAADAWLERARAAFLDAYGGISASDEPLLAAFELEKACYEVRYEATNRPGWLWLPLAAVERIVADGPPAGRAAGDLP